MNSNAFFEILKQAPSDASSPVSVPGAAERQEGRWRVLPLEGTFEIVYEDSRGAWSTRRVEARELKLGPGRTLLGGLDRGRGGPSARGERGERGEREHDERDESAGGGGGRAHGRFLRSFSASGQALGPAGDVLDGPENFPESGPFHLS